MAYVTLSTIWYAHTTTFTTPGAFDFLETTTVTDSTSLVTITKTSTSTVIAPVTSTSQAISSTSTNPIQTQSSGTPGLSSRNGSLTLFTGPERSTRPIASKTITPALGSTSSSFSSRISPSNSDTKLIACIGVLSALLAIALVVIIFILLRRRCRRTRSFRSSEDSEIRTEPSLEISLAKLEAELKAQDIELRRAQSALLSSKKRPSIPRVDDKCVHGQFAKLNQEINDWVLTHFKHVRPIPIGESLPELDAVVVANQSTYFCMLQESRTRFLLLRAVVADIIVEAFICDELLGSEEFTRMSKGIAAQGSIEESARWRALTISLLPESPMAQQVAIDRIAESIEHSTSSLVDLASSTSRLQQLRQIVRSAAELALKLAQQCATFRFERPKGSSFDAATMEDVLQEKKGEELRGRKVQCSIFPSVLRYGDDAGQGFDRATLISKALVLV